MCYTYGHMCVLSFSVVTFSLYGTLSNVHDGLYMRHMGLAMAVCVIGGITYVISNVAHHAANEVSVSVDSIWGRLFPYLTQKC